MQVHYLEVVTDDVDATCNGLEKLHDLHFGDTVASLGDARTAPLENGGSVGVRAPMSESEKPIVRPYVVVEDILAAVEAVEDAGGEIAHPPTEIPGRGSFAIYTLGGIQHGLWQV